MADKVETMTCAICGKPIVSHEGLYRIGPPASTWSATRSPLFNQPQTETLPTNLIGCTAHGQLWTRSGLLGKSSFRRPIRCTRRSG